MPQQHSRPPYWWTRTLRLNEHNIKPGRSRRGSRHQQVFKAGQVVRESGVYEVVHDREHRPAHDVLMHRDELFPDCDQCHSKVRFLLVRTAPYIFDDEDFRES